MRNYSFVIWKLVKWLGQIKFKIFIYSLMEPEMEITCTCHQAKIAICCQMPLVAPIALKICTRGFSACWIQNCYLLSAICSMTTPAIQALRVLFYLEMADKMWRKVVDSFDDVVGCNYLLQSLTPASSHCEGGLTWRLGDHSCPCLQILYGIDI